MQEFAFYQEDLAFVHDHDFGHIAKYGAKHLNKLLKDRGLNNGRIVDLGCGSGILAKALSEGGFEVLGIDFSAEMVKIAKRQAPKAQFKVGSFLEMEIPSCVAVTATGEIFNYLIDSSNNIKKLEQLFREIYRQLLPNGIFLFDVLCLGLPALDGIKFLETPEWDMTIKYVEDTNTKRLKREIILFRKVKDNQYRKSKEVHEVRLYESSFVYHLLEQIGFSVEKIDRYADYPFRNRHVGFIASKTL